MLESNFGVIVAAVDKDDPASTNMIAVAILRMKFNSERMNNLTRFLITVFVNFFKLTFQNFTCRA